VHLNTAAELLREDLNVLHATICACMIVAKGWAMQVIYAR
jgi:hypothetical protein